MSTETDLRRIVSALEGRKEGSSYRCRCIGHEGRSLIVTLREDTILVNCKSGCSQEDVIEGLKGRNLWPNGTTPAPTPPMTLETQYPYIGADGSPVAIKGRFRKPNGDKSFAWKRPEDEKWGGLRGLKEKELPLYNGHLIPTTDGPVIVVEGEKAAAACLDAGLLAVCPPGGAGAKEFGDQFKPLEGRDVILLPDNDAEGRALMQRISLRLQGIADSVRTICLDVPPKGDAYDYFKGSGTKDALLADAAKIRVAPWLETEATGYLVGIPGSGGVVMMRFDSLEERPHVLQAEVAAWAEMPGLTRDRFAARLNILSLSNRDQFRRQLEDVVPLVKGAWTGFINKACELVRQTHAETDPSMSLTAISGTEVVAHYVIKPLVLEDGPTIKFGKGGTSKTNLALAEAVCIGKGRDFLGQPCQQGPVLFLDYESTAARIKGRLLRILAGMDLEWDNLPFVYWPGRGRPLPEIVPALRRKILDLRPRLIIIDSAALAAGGEPEKAEIAIKYFNALSTLETPSLTLGHVTKGGEDEYPFGSVFWNNSARLTWNIKVEHEDGRNVAHIGLFNRKSNENRLMAPFGIRAEFDATSVRFSREELQAGTSDRLAMPGRIRNMLREGAMSVKELAAELGLPDNAVRTYLGRISDVIRLRKADDGSGLWGIKANE